MFPLPKLRLGAALVAAFVLAQPPARAAMPDYKLGDVAREDVITPVQLLVVNPEATDALKQKVSQQVPLIVRHTPQSVGEAEADLRDTIAKARTNFMASLEGLLPVRATGESEVDSPAIAKAIQELARVSPKDLPVARLAPLWLKAQSDTPLLESLLQPVREVMALPIVESNQAGTPLPSGQFLRLIRIKNPSDVPTVQELETAGPAPKIITVFRARRLVETSFPSGQEDLGRFAASFVRANAFPDSGLTELLRAKRLDGVTVNDTYEAAQVIVRQGQVIDRKALSALTAMREKSLIGTLQTKLEQEQSVAGQITKQTKWIVAGLGIMCGALILILWRLRTRPSSELVLANPALGGADPLALPGGAGEDAWRTRAITAEGKAERAQEAIRTGALGWMREKIFQTLFRQRTELLTAQQKAGAEMRELEQRLEQLHTPLQERITAYEKRIEELEKDLAAKGEENRELIGARISVVKQRLTAERERGRFGSN